MADEVRLIDIIKEFISGDWGEENATEDTPCAVSCVRGADIVPISNSRFENIPVRYISASSLKNRGLSEGDIIIEKSGGSPTQSTGRTVFVSKKLVEAKKNIVCSNFCQAFRIKEGWNPLYVYYYLQVVYNSGVFFNFEGKTSGLKNLILDSAFQSITIKKVPLEEQDRVANMLSLIDEKIATNHAINDYLEAMARQLYDYWFVQYDFPDKNGKPYKSTGGKMTWNARLKKSIPLGWRIDSLASVCETRLGGTPNTGCESFWGGEYRWLNSGEVAAFPILTSEKTITKEGLDASATAFLPIGSVTLSITRHLRASIMAINACINQSVVGILETDLIRKEFLYPFISAEIPHLMVLRTGAQQPHINKDIVDSINIIIPPTEILSNYYERVSSIYADILSSSKEILLLENQKKLLLPLLMNGQVSIKPLNNHLSAD